MVAQGGRGRGRRRSAPAAHTLPSAVRRRLLSAATSPPLPRASSPPATGNTGNRPASFAKVVWLWRSGGCAPSGPTALSAGPVDLPHCASPRHVARSAPAGAGCGWRAVDKGAPSKCRTGNCSEILRAAGSARVPSALLQLSAGPAAAIGALCPPAHRAPDGLRSARRSASSERALLLFACAWASREGCQQRLQTALVVRVLQSPCVHVRT